MQLKVRDLIVSINFVFAHLQISEIPGAKMSIKKTYKNPDLFRQYTRVSQLHPIIFSINLKHMLDATQQSKFVQSNAKITVYGSPSGAKAHEYKIGLLIDIVDCLRLCKQAYRLRNHDRLRDTSQPSRQIFKFHSLRSVRASASVFIRVRDPTRV